MRNKVRDYMTRQPEIIDRTTTIQQAARIMASLDLGMLLVGTPDYVVGVVTDRDLVTRGLAMGLDPRIALVEALIDHPAVTCWEEDTVEAALGTMVENKIRRLLVVDDHQLPIGVLSLDDIAAHGADQRLIAEAFQSIVMPLMRSA